MKRVVTILAIFSLVVSCGSGYFAIQERQQVWATGHRIQERSFKMPEEFGAFRFDMVRRTGGPENMDILYLRAEHTGPQRLIVNALWVTVDGTTYEVAPARSLQQNRETAEDRSSNRYFLSQVYGFIFSENLKNVMINATEQVVFTVIGEKQHHGANIYYGKELEKLQASLTELVTNT